MAAVTSETKTGQSARQYARYLLFLLLVSALVYPLAFLIVRAPGYEQWGATPYGPMLEYGYDDSSPNADVVVFGDSSAFLDIDPRQIDAALGIQAVVIPSTVGSLPVMRDAPLRHYLEHHAAPKLVVLYFSPWNLNMGHLATGRMFEGEEMLLRHGTRQELWNFFGHYPLELLEFPLRLYSTFGPKMLKAFLHGDNRAARTKAAFGHANYVDPFPTLTDACKLPAEFTAKHSTETLQALAERYTTDRTRAVVYLAPIPSCTGAETVAQGTHPELGAAAPRVLPAQLFADDHYFAHVWPAHVHQSTDVFVERLKQLLAQAQTADAATR